MNLSCRTAEFPRTRSGGNSDGRQERKKGLVSGCAAIPRVFQAHGMKTGNGVAGTGQAVVGEKGNALASRCTHQGIIVGDIHAGIGRCQGLVGTGTDALPWVAATRRKGGSVPLVECNRHPGRRRAAQGVQNGGIQGACGSVPGVLSQTALVLGATAQFPLPTRIRNRPHFLAPPDPVATAPVFDPTDAATGNGVMAGSEAPALRKPPGNSYPLRLPLPRQPPTLPFSATDPLNKFYELLTVAHKYVFIIVIH